MRRRPRAGSATGRRTRGASGRVATSRRRPVAKQTKARSRSQKRRRA
jgi:hypothetical protein